MPNTAAFAFDAINGGGVNNYYTQTKKNTVFESYLNYKKDYGKHSFDVMGGYSWQRFYVENYYKIVIPPALPLKHLKTETLQNISSLLFYQTKLRFQ